MVRPRASEQNIRIALAFADAVTVQTKPGMSKDLSTILVARKGRQSIHAAFAACFPDLARDSKEKRPKNRQGVAVMEMNKALQAAGLKSVRKRDRVEGGVRWRSKVHISPEGPKKLRFSVVLTFALYRSIGLIADGLTLPILWTSTPLLRSWPACSRCTFSCASAPWSEF
jgi:hypothetical protein